MIWWNYGHVQVSNLYNLKKLMLVLSLNSTNLIRTFNGQKYVGPWSRKTFGYCSNSLRNMGYSLSTLRSNLETIRMSYFSIFPTMVTVASKYRKKYNSIKSFKQHKAVPISDLIAFFILMISHRRRSILHRKIGTALSHR